MMDSLELVAPSLRVPKEIRDMTVYLFSDEDVTGWRRLDAGGGVDAAAATRALLRRRPGHGPGCSESLVPRLRIE